MKHVPNLNSKNIAPIVARDLDEKRRVENFNAKDYVNAKIRLMAAYFKQHRLDAAVVAVSGGVDSACVLGLLKAMQRQQPEVLKRIVAVTMPASKSHGVTNQDETVEKTKRLAKAFELEIKPIEMGQALLPSVSAVCLATGAPQLSPWAEGQVVPYLRATWLYGITASLSDQGHRAVLVGTTNKDEGAYLGFFGKASDGLVDLQPISDLHKSQVKSVAQALGVPEEIVTAIPTGDMHDARIDEDVFGASYDEVEWALRNMSETKENAEASFLTWSKGLKIPPVERKSALASMRNLDELHAYNRHKYLGGSPAVHLDLLPCQVKGGWHTNATRNKPKEVVLDPTRWVNRCEGAPTLEKTERAVDLERGPQGILVFRSVLTSEECKRWTTWSENKKDRWVRTNTQGKLGNPAEAGSWRKTTDSTEAAKELYARLAKSGLPSLYNPTYPASDLAKDGLAWTRTGISTVWRWIKYDTSDKLVPHYDDTFIHSSHKRTLMSVLVYLTDGETHFLSDPRFPQTHTDWEGGEWPPTTYSVKAKAGDVLVFDHRLFHSGPAVEKIKRIVRTDLIFEKPNLGGAIEHH